MSYTLESGEEVYQGEGAETDFWLNPPVWLSRNEKGDLVKDKPRIEAFELRQGPNDKHHKYKVPPGQLVELPRHARFAIPQVAPHLRMVNAKTKQWLVPFEKNEAGKIVFPINKPLEGFAEDELEQYEAAGVHPEGKVTTPSAPAAGAGRADENLQRAAKSDPRGVAAAAGQGDTKDEVGERTARANAQQNRKPKPEPE